MHIRKKDLKKQLLTISDKCFYCGLEFDINPVPEGQPLCKKLKTYSKMVVVMLGDDGDHKPNGSNQTLAHLWCQTKASQMSWENRLVFKETLTLYFTHADGLPWLDKKLLKRYLRQRGDLISLMQAVQQSSK